MGRLIQGDGHVSSDLIKIFEILNNLIEEKNLSEIYTIFQKYGRSENQERWQLGKLHENKKTLLLPLFKKLGIIEEVLPQLKVYRAIIILGGAVSRMRARVHFLEKLWTEGVRSQQILFLVGERPLSTELNEEKDPFSREHSSIPFRPQWLPSRKQVKTEADVVPVVWDQIISREDLRNREFQVFSTPFVKDEETLKMRRPDTADTIQTWIARESPHEGPYLVISNNPFIPYQNEVVRAVFEKEGLLEKASLETAGPAALPNLGVASYMDALFTWFRTEFNRFEDKR